jgi:hypothetical protein
MRPTELADMNFQTAVRAANDAVNIEAAAKGAETYDINMAKAIRSMAVGLGQLSTGLRATYMLLDEVNGKLDRLTRSRPGLAP